MVNEPDGTAHAAQSQAVLIGGKTGTAQVVGKQRGVSGEKYMDHAWFVGFAPVDKPEIALSVFVEHGGHGGSAAAPIAKRAIEAYLVKPKPAAAGTAGPIQKTGDLPVESSAAPGSNSSNPGNNENAQGGPE